MYIFRLRIKLVKCKRKLCNSRWVVAVMSSYVKDKNSQTLDMSVPDACYIMLCYVMWCSCSCYACHTFNILRYFLSYIRIHVFSLPECRDAIGTGNPNACVCFTARLATYLPLSFPSIFPHSKNKHSICHTHLSHEEETTLLASSCVWKEHQWFYPYIQAGRFVRLWLCEICDASHVPPDHGWPSTYIQLVDTINVFLLILTI